MPAVVTYWQLRQDELEFFEFLSTTGTVVAVPDHWVRTKAELEPRPILSYVEEVDPTQLCFGLEAHARLSETVIQEDDGETLFSLAQMSPCLISYSRGRQSEGRLGQSNLSAYWKFPSADASTVIEKDPEFLAWAKRVFSWLRKYTPERIVCNEFHYRATKRVKAAVDSRLLEVVLY